MKRSSKSGTLALLAGVTAAFGAIPRSAQAEEVPGPVVVEKTTTQATGPSMIMVGSGVIIFGLAYLPAVVVGASSGLDADHTLFVPIAGPWIDFAQRPGCSPASQCNAENTNKVLLATDGIVQALGALTVIGGFLTPAHETTRVRSRRSAPALTLHVLPAQVGASGYGVVALGDF
ncbi:MAG: hypothetical protein ACRENE_01790 [Polyangiaceae bacterium]